MRALRTILVVSVMLSAPSLSSSLHANCTESVVPVFQCGFAGWFAPPPSGSGEISAVWWQLGYGNNLINNGAPPTASLEGTGIAPAGVFSGNDSGLFGIEMTEAGLVLPQYAPSIPAGALCSNFENSWAGYQVDGCADNPRTTGGNDNDNLLNPYWGGVYGPGDNPPQYTTNYQIDYPMGMLLRESSGRFFALAFVASKKRVPPRGSDISENFFDLGEVSNGDLNPVHGRPNVIPWQPVPRPRVDGFEIGEGTVTLDLSWDSILLVHDASSRPNTRVVAGGVGVLDQLAQPGGLCRYQLQTAPVTVSNPNPSTLTWTNAGPVIPCPAGGGPSPPLTATLTVGNNSAIRIRTLLGKLPRTASTLLDDVRTGASGDLGYEATDCTADDCVQSPPLLVVANAPENQAPFVDAGPDMNILLEDVALLNGGVTDDGLPVTGSLVTIWSKESGPGTVSFGDPAAVDTTASFSAPGIYVLRLTATDGDLSTSDQVTIVVGRNEAPVVDAGLNQTITLPSGAVLHGVVTDDGLPPGAAITTAWSVDAGPGMVQFADPAALDTIAAFSLAGTYILRLTASDGLLEGSDTVTISVNMALVNQPPGVYAGPDQTIQLPAQAFLDGTVHDDGLPIPSSLLTQWSKQSGPGVVTFGNPGLVDTMAQFSSPGTYVLVLSAFDGELGASDTLTIQVNASAQNQPPGVSAGADHVVVLPGAATLDGTLTDDGIPGSLVSIWSMDAGPASVAFGNPLAVDTSAVFPEAGTYVLRLVATDGAASASDTATVVAISPGTGYALEKRITAGADDAEERSAGVMLLTSTDLDMSFDGEPQVVGLRFPDLPIPPGATIVGAWVQFTADEERGGSARVTLRAQAADAAPAFTTAPYGISSRTTTLAAVAWDIPDWLTPGEAGPGQRTPDLSPLIQEVVNRPGWAAGGALAFVITGTGHRAAKSFEAGAATAALLHIELAESPGNAPPLVDAGPDQSIRLPAGATLQGSATDDGLPFPPGAMTTLWTQTDGPAGAVIASPQSLTTTVSFAAAGTYTFQLSASDGVDEVTDLAMVLVEDPIPSLVTLDLGIAAAADDAEEKSGGTMVLDSSDIELVQDTTTQTVGLRFTGVTIPAGAIIRAAWLQFRTDETGSGATSLTIQGEAAVDPGAFTSTPSSISTRARTAAAVPWSPAPWTIVGEAGLSQRTPDLSAIVQELVGQPGWSPGGAMVFVVTGTGRRTAEAFESGAALAPRLHVEYE